MSTLHTARLRLEPFTAEHAGFLLALWTDPAVRRYLWDDRLVSDGEVMEIVRASDDDFRSRRFGMWTLFAAPGGEPLGFCGLRRFDGDDVEILYALLPAWWGKGLATEATAEVLRHAFAAAGLEAVYAGADPPNTASIRVMERLGMRPDSVRVIHGVETAYFVLRKGK